jgi:hypothetical protein
MRNLLLAVVGLALTLEAASAQTPWGNKVFFGVTNYDFGTIPHGAKVPYRLKMKNIYAVPLQIVNIRLTCDCLKVEKSHEVLNPQQAGHLDLLMDGKRFKGPKVLTMYVSLQSPDGKFASTAEIRVTAHTRTDVVFNPQELDFQVQTLGTSVSRSIEVEYAGELDWRILEVVKGADAPFDVTPEETYRRSNGLFRKTKEVGYRITVTLKADARPGPFRQELQLKTNDPISPKIPVLVEGNILAPLTVAPGIVNMGTLKVGAAEKRRVSIRAARPFRVTRVEGAGNGITVQMPENPATSHFLTIELRGTQAGELRRNLTIYTDLDGGASAIVQVEASVEQ